jgi:hypothetical protein
MNRRIRIALTAGFTALAERAVRRYIDASQQQRAARIIWVQRNRSITFPLFSFLDFNIPELCCAAAVRGGRTPETTSPTLALPRKLVFSSTVVKLSPSFRLGDMPAAQSQSANVMTTGSVTGRQFSTRVASQCVSETQAWRAFLCDGVRARRLKAASG